MVKNSHRTWTNQYLTSVYQLSNTTLKFVNGIWLLLLLVYKSTNFYKLGCQITASQYLVLVIRYKWQEIVEIGVSHHTKIIMFVLKWPNHYLPNCFLFINEKCPNSKTTLKAISSKSIPKIYCYDSGWETIVSLSIINRGTFDKQRTFDKLERLISWNWQKYYFYLSNALTCCRVGWLFSLNHFCNFGSSVSGSKQILILGFIFPETLKASSPMFRDPGLERNRAGSYPPKYRSRSEGCKGKQSLGLGREPWSSRYGRRLMFQRSWV